MSRGIPEGRDLTLDLARVTCVVLVVFVHVLFTGVGVAEDGSLLIERTVEKQPWFNAASWILNIMPLFFVVGGYAARAGWRSTLAKGGTAESFVRTRLMRLARPALIVFVFFAVVLTAVRFVPIPGISDLVDTIAIGVGSPLWFLAAYLIAQAFAPFMIRLHERAPIVTVATLAVAAFAIDMFRIHIVTAVWNLDRVDLSTYGSGSEIFGLPNVLFVWLLCQQVGFFLFDGVFARRAWWQLLALIVGGYAVLWVFVETVGYSVSMLGNQWPPTLTMGVLAVVQAAALTLLHAPLSALMRNRVMQGIVFFFGARLMTIYLWHLPMIMVITGIQLILPLPMPAPGSPAWWLTRVPFMLVVLAALWVRSLAIDRVEALPDGDNPRTERWRVVTGVTLFVVPSLLITIYSLDLWLAIAGAIGSAAAIAVVSSRTRQPQRRL